MSDPKEQTVIDYKSLNSDRIVDDVINAATANSIANIISKNGFTFNSKNIGILLLLTSLGDVKKMVVEIIEFTKKYLFENFAWLISKIPDFVLNSMIVKHINSYFYKEPEISHPATDIVVKPKTIKYDLELGNEEIIYSLIYYVENNPDIGRCNKKLESKKYIGFSDIEEIIHYDNIELSNGIEININRNMKYINKKYQKNIKDDVNVKKSIVINNLYEYIKSDNDEKYNYPAWLNLVKLQARCRTKSHTVIEYLDIQACCAANAKVYIENSLMNIAKEFNNGVDLQEEKNMWNYMVEFMLILLSMHKNLSPKEIKLYYSSRKYYFFKQLNLFIKITDGSIKEGINISSGFLNQRGEPNCELLLKKYNNWEGSVSRNVNISLTTKNQSINLNKYSDKLLQDAFEFYKSQQSNEKIKIFNLSINRTFEEEKKDNPDYEAFKNNKKEILEEIKDIDDKDIKTEMMKQIKNPPPQFLIEHKETINVKSDFVSEQSKPIDTLYLRKKDMFQLKSVLNNFGNCSEIYAELGIRKKLGLMFHGVPGTGKSTSIVTIASYLKKDIYYLNMNTIKTNAELQMIFDYVLKNCSKTGIIVIEEIEKQTDVVLKNHELKDETMTDILNKKEGKLNLSYFLNLLDGTLSQEETVYIMTTNHIDKLEPALYRAGRIDKMIEFKKCDKYQIEIIYERIMKRKIDSDVLDSIPEDVYTPADIIFHLVSYIYETELDDGNIMEKFMTSI
jgi:ATP-dependent 26S proteasome regulatory subunit